MITLDPRDALVLARERAGYLHRERTATRPRPSAGKRHALATWLRRAANLPDPAPLARTAYGR